MRFTFYVGEYVYCDISRSMYQETCTYCYDKFQYLIIILVALGNLNQSNYLFHTSIYLWNWVGFEQCKIWILFNFILIIVNIENRPRLVSRLDKNFRMLTVLAIIFKSDQRYNVCHQGCFTYSVICLLPCGKSHYKCHYKSYYKCHYKSHYRCPLCGKSFI